MNFNTELESAIEALKELGIDTDDLNEDYYKIPLENTDLSKYEKEHPSKGKITSKHTIIIDSRQRDYSIYPLPNYYQVELMESHRNVERIELIAAMMPKTEYNINSENNLIILTIDNITEALTLTPGQYLIGSNVPGNVNYKSDGAPVFTGLLNELKRVLNIHTRSENNFNVFLVTTPESGGGTGSNSAILNRIAITNISKNFKIDFRNIGYPSGSPFRVLGFLKQEYTSTLTNEIYGYNNYGNCTQENLESNRLHILDINSLVSVFDYNLKDDPHYIIMQLAFGNRSADRVESIDIATNQKFAVVIYDSNEPDNIQNHNSTANIYNPIQIGFSRQPGILKALKGSDFDKKILEFTPSITLESFTISFFKYDNTPYNFHNREHLLTFELDVADYDPTYRY
jgi:hypothetical protein